MHQLLAPLSWPLSRWAQSSQQGACRNAMVASTALAAGRQERDETQEYVESVLARRARRTGPGSRTHAAAAW